MAILTRDEILALLADNNSGNITEKVLRDVVDSIIGIGGTMYGVSNDPDNSSDRINLNVVDGWQPFGWFTNSVDTKGINEDLPQGNFTVGVGAGGLYKVDVSMSIISGVAGWLELAITKNGILTPYRTRRSLSVNGSGSFNVIGSGDLVDGDTIGLVIRPSGAPPANMVAMIAGQFRVIR